MSKRRGWRRNPILGAILLCVLIAVVWFFAWYQSALKPLSTSVKTTNFVISRGESFATVADALEKQGLIRSATALSLYYRLHRGHTGIQAGTYTLSPSLSPVQMLDDFLVGKAVYGGISVTIPEGYDVAEIAARLQQDDICSKSAFLDAEEHAKFAQPFLSDLSSRKGIRYRLEGFLFPDTYQFQANESPVDVINDMLNDFQTRVLTPQTINKLNATHMTLNQMLTEASLIENEAEVDSERPLIASVINNRLKQGMKLQIDATVDYALGRHVDVMTTNYTTQTHSPYNTYLVAGLPPGPIDNPGDKSIAAVLNPAHTNYIYYVAKGDGSGEHYFSATYSEQLHNEQLRSKNLSKAQSK